MMTITTRARSIDLLIYIRLVVIMIYGSAPEEIAGCSPELLAAKHFATNPQCFSSSCDSSLDCVLQLINNDNEWIDGSRD